LAVTDNSFNPTLKQQIADFKAVFVTQIPADAATGIDADIARSVASGIADQALKAEASAPDFSLPAVSGEALKLSDLLGQRPVVLAFYRGEWCPYCNLQLRAYQQALPHIKELGARLVAVSPQTPDHSLSFTEKLELAFPVLTDKGNAVARRYGLVYHVSNNLRAIYERLGIDLQEYDGDDSWELPISATYVIDQQGVIRLAFVDADFTHRLEPSTVLETLRDLKGRGE
jgi:peroxiredoxin